MIKSFLKDPDDIKRLWKPDIFIDQAITVRWEIRALVVKSMSIYIFTQDAKV